VSRCRANVLLLISIAGLVYFVVNPLSAKAQTGPSVTIECPTLSEEQRASIEVRTRAELALSPLALSQLRVRCVSRLLLVEVVDSGNQIRTNSATLDADTRLWADQILALMHSLVADAGQSESALRPQEPVVPPAAGNESSRPNAPVVTPAAPPHRDAPNWYQTHALSLAVGPCVEFWAKPMNLQLGPCAAIGVPTSPFSRLAFTGGAKWSLTEPSNIEIRHWHGGVEAQFGPKWWVGFGTQLSVLSLVPNSGLLPKSQRTFEPVLTVRGGYAATVAGQRLLASAGLRGYPESREVRVNGQRAFTIPMVAVTVAVEYEFGI
jgi:hypothetical protein